MGCFASLPYFFRPQGFGSWENIAALMALIKARSESPELDIMAQSVHLFLFHLRARLWFEWVPSQSSWSDEISRKGLRDKWHQDHHFRTHASTVPCYQGCFGVWRAADSFAKRLLTCFRCSRDITIPVAGLIFKRPLCTYDVMSYFCTVYRCWESSEVFV